ncbi:MAG: glycosyltransferase [Solirubrobacterales bacterium]|nr:glycosyltransferase [Solirubrobacterales bacterium]MBV9421777.1 glycosyltransferase [Solirubrobacterales bacterium]
MTGLTHPEVSVVVCTRNGEPTLTATLLGLRRQSLDSARYEVIVVDDGSTDRTTEVAESHGARVVEPGPPGGLAAARNAGVSASRGDVIAFTDDDCEPEESWLETLLACFTDARIDGVGGRVVPACSTGFLLRYLQARNPLSPLPAELLRSTRLKYRLRLYLRSVLQSRPGLRAGAALYSPVGANMALRKDVVLGLGGFDPAFRFGFEEEDLCRRGHRRAEGLRIRYEPGAVVVHSFDRHWKDSLRRAWSYGRGHGLATAKDVDLRPIVYPFPVMSVVAFILALVGRRGTPLIFVLLAPLAVYARWPARAWGTRSPEPLAYPYLQLAEEVWTMLGELQGWRAGYFSDQ